METIKVFKEEVRVSKVERYGWIITDNPPEFKYIDKHCLSVDTSYQRPIVANKARKFAAEWSWVSCGCILVTEYGGKINIVDGQHRHWAAMQRSDIQKLPCLVYETNGPKQAAKGFRLVNKDKVKFTAFDDYKASVVSGDPDAQYVKQCVELSGFTVTTSARNGMETKCIGELMKMAKEDKDSLLDVMTFSSCLCVGHPLRRRMLECLWYFNKFIDGGLGNKRFSDRIKDIGVERLERAARAFAESQSLGGARIWATGMLLAINKGLRNKFEFTYTDQKLKGIKQ